MQLTGQQAALRAGSCKDSLSEVCHVATCLPHEPHRRALRICMASPASFAGKARQWPPLPPRFG